MKVMCIVDKWDNPENDPVPKFGEECKVKEAYTNDKGSKYFILYGYPDSIGYLQKGFVQIDTDVIETVEQLELAA